MEILSFKSLPSTQTYLIEQLYSGKLQAPVAILALEQSAGIGSRDNEWSGGKGNFFVSIALPLNALPKDLPLASASIYFSFIMKQILQEAGEEVWLKWPNDFYHKDHKIGGTITKKIGNVLICGMGINLKKSQNAYSSLESDIDPEDLLEMYLSSLLKVPKWKQIFSEYKVEFELSRKFSVHMENKKKSLFHASLCDDGSLIIQGERVYSLR